MTEDSITAALGAYVEAGQLAGAAALVWCNGRVVQTTCVGMRDLDSGQPIERDTLFRLASMSKPITSVAALILLEQSRFALDEPITRWAPEFTEMRVLSAPNGPLDQTVPAERPITFGDLLTHRSGLTYADFQTGPVAAAYMQALGGDLDSHLSPDDWIAHLGALPLIDQPGAAFHYGHSTDLLGLLLSRIEGAPLGDVLRRLIFDPLGMADTGFIVPPAKWSRRSAPHGFDESGRLIRRASVPGGHALPERLETMTYESGGQGLWSTLDDYLSFARLFLGAGTVDGVQLLRPETVARMTANHLTASQRATSEMFGLPLFAEGHGFGLGVAVVMEPEQAPAALCGGGLGAVGWPGAYGTWWRADPSDQSVLILLSQNMLEVSQMARGIGLGIYSAITRFQALASSAGR